MQFKAKLMNQFWENGKKANFGTDFLPNLVHKNVVHKYYLY